MLNIFCFILLPQVIVSSELSLTNLNLSYNAVKLRATQSFLMESYMDFEADACKDFYQYACGNWDKMNPIPDNKEFWGNLHVAASTELQKIGDLLNINQQTDSDAVRKAKDFYNSCMNITKIDEEGKRPLIDYINTLGNWPVIDENLTGDGSQWLNLLVEAHRLGIGIIFNSMVYDDMFNSSRYTLTVLHSTLAFENGEKFLENGNELKAYKILIGNVLKEFGVNNSSANTITEEIVNFETELAKIVIANQKGGNFMEQLTATTIGDLQKNYSSIDWKRYYELLHHKNFMNSEQVLVLTINFVKNLDILIKNTPKKTMFNFLMWKIVILLGDNIGKEFRSFHDQYTAAVTNVQTSIPPRSEKCVSKTMENFRDAVGSMYVQKYFSTDARADAKDLLSRLKKSYKNLIQNANWITESEKTAAILKLDKMGMEIGYPDYILDDLKLNKIYENISINPSDYFGNMLNLLIFDTEKEIKLLDKIVDKTDWPVSFMEQGSIYVFTKQRLFTSVMMFRPPIYHKDLPKFMNFGGVGVTMAHEIGHGFDSNGISFDHDGNANNWFSNASKIEYNKREACFIDKYNNYSLNGKNMSGSQVSAEAIADDVGIKVAYAAYMDWINENKNSADLEHEQFCFTLSNEKMFFISSAQLNCEAIRPRAWPDIWDTETHTVQQYRVNGVMSNSKEFAKAFNCTVGSYMNPAKKCTIW